MNDKKDPPVPGIGTHGAAVPADASVLVRYGAKALSIPIMVAIHAEVLSNVTRLEDGKVYELPQICRSEFWELFPQKTEAGICMRYMADKGYVPFMPLGPGSNNHQRYRFDKSRVSNSLISFPYVLPPTQA